MYSFDITEFIRSHPRQMHRAFGPSTSLKDASKSFDCVHDPLNDPQVRSKEMVSEVEPLRQDLGEAERENNLQGAPPFILIQDGACSG